ncbi:MAG TPA: hypothetical protein VGK40_02300 [Verrucomicrobiae bacterium]|jgi:hypothetical protein
MAKKATMLLVDEELLVQEAIGRALFGAVEPTASARVSLETMPDVSENPFYKALLEIDLDSDTEWDAFPTSCLPGRIRRTSPTVV